MSDGVAKEGRPKFNPQPQWGGGGCTLPYIDYTLVCAAGQGMVFRHLSLEQGI